MRISNLIDTQKIIQSLQRLPATGFKSLQIGISASRDWYDNLSRGQRISVYLLAFFVLGLVIVVVLFTVRRH